MNSVYTIVSGGPPYQVGPYAGPSRGVFYELRVARSDVVSLSLSRRNAASESEADCGRQTATGTKKEARRPLFLFKQFRLFFFVFIVAFDSNGIECRYFIVAFQFLNLDA